MSVSIPDDVMVDLDRVRTHLGFSNIEALIRAFIGHGLRSDLERLESGPNLTVLANTLRKHGVDEKVIAVAIREAETASPRSSTLQLPAPKARRS